MQTAMLTVHLLGAVVWVGGLALIWIVLLPAARRTAETRLLVETLARSQGLFRLCSLVMFLSGGYLIGTRYPVSSWFTTRAGGAAFAMMLLWLILTVVGELSGRPRRELAAGQEVWSALTWLYGLALAVGLFLLLDAAWGFGP